jgi:hypothetical protein
MYFEKVGLKTKKKSADTDKMYVSQQISDQTLNDVDCKYSQQSTLNFHHKSLYFLLS